MCVVSGGKAEQIPFGSVELNKFLSALERQDMVWDVNGMYLNVIRVIRAIRVIRVTYPTKTAHGLGHHHNPCVTLINLAITLMILFYSCECIYIYTYI